MKEFCDKQDIVIISYNPLASSMIARYYNSKKNDEFNPFKEKIFIDLAKKYKKTEGQIILNWEHSQGVIPIPGTSKTWRMQENLDALKFKMEDKDIEEINNHFLQGRKKRFNVGYKYFGINIFG